MLATLRLLAVTAFTALGFASPAQAALHKTDWTCWLHGDTRVACTVIAAMDAADPQAAPVRALKAMGSAELMQAVRSRPEDTAGQVVFVPLMTVPFGDSMVHQLLSSVLCGARTDCTTSYHANLNHVIASSPALFADMADPVLGGTLQ